MAFRGKKKYGIGKKKKELRPVNEVVEELKVRGKSTSNNSYREQSLKIHGLICAKCGREYEEKDRHLLTVHHKDSDHHNNPQDGSNWENLCIYCHDDEHSRGILGDYLNGKHDK